MNEDRKDFAPHWERLLHDELRGLPDHEAPADLAPNVMALIRTRRELESRAWYRRPFLLWPRAVQLAFGSGALALFAVLAWNAPALWAQLPGWPQPPTFLARGLSELSAFTAAARALLDALSLAATTFFTPARTAIVVVIIASQIALLGVGGSIWRQLVLRQARGFRENLLPFHS